ncbi:CheR family methyltransferase [Paludibaculum fermentans]|uniref:protein-glutamate O-methyltransferase n=1 Tax=Paludibaculum fermentans TaxID=1473598 RepID=A0A7S7SLB6_PALFE|nr:protein-glutamate O-methyltransferase CheR [Paludibaculum fermentans]QOY88658.1 protein-glutamate O-methyltransferase CheR [Paludibaculum fermentans]
MPPETTPLIASQTVQPGEFRKIQSLTYQVAGIDLREGKEALVGARLNKRIRELGLKDVSSYLNLVEADRTGLELIALIDALTTNFTSFLREPQHFEFLRSVILPALATRASIRIWSAGCSTGEEPYSILFHLAQALGQAELAAVEILATDISTRALSAASAGVYPASRMKELPEAWRKRFFQRGVGGQDGMVRVREEWRSRIRFQRLNLMEEFTNVAVANVIFCRNVMIYFDKQTQQKLVRRFAERLEPGGWLLIGHSEGLMGMEHELSYVMPAVYRKPSGRKG